MWTPPINLLHSRSYVNQSPSPAVLKKPPSESPQPPNVEKPALKWVPVPSIKVEPLVSLDEVIGQITLACSRSKVSRAEISLFCEQLNIALLNSACPMPKHDQVRFVQLSCLLQELPRSEDWNGLKGDLEAHLRRTNEQAIYDYKESFLPGFWPLHAKILALPGVTLDLFGNAIRSLCECLRNEKSNDDWARRLDALLPKLLRPTRDNFSQDSTLENVILSCTSLLFILKKRTTGNCEKAKIALEIVQKSYQSFKANRADQEISVELAAPQVHSLRLDSETGLNLFNPTVYEGYDGYVRFNHGLSFCLESDGKAKIPSEQEWIRLVLGQILGYSRDLFTFMKVGMVPPGSKSMVNYVLRVGLDHKNQELTREEKSLEFVISLLVGSKETREESFLNSSVDAAVVEKFSELSSHGIVLDCLILLEQHSQSYARWIKEEALGKENLHLDEGSALPFPLFITPKFALDLHDSLNHLMNKLKVGRVTHKDLEYVMPTPSLLNDNARQWIIQETIAFLQSLNPNTLSMFDRVSLMGKTLARFPEVSASPHLGWNESETGEKHFYQAVKQGHVALVRRFLEEEKTAKTNLGTSSLLAQTLGDKAETALSIAASDFHFKAVQLLLRYGKGSTGVMNAIFSCLERFTEAPTRVALIVGSLLHQVSCDQLNRTVGRKGWTLLHLLVSVSKPAPEVADPLLIQLVRKGALLNIVSIDGSTPLDLAIEMKDQRMAHRLIQLGALCAPSLFGPNPLELSDFLPQEDFLSLKSRDLALRWFIDLTDFGKYPRVEETLKSYLFKGSLSGPHVNETSLPQSILNKNCEAKEMEETEVPALFRFKLPPCDYDLQEFMRPLLSSLSNEAFEPHQVDCFQESGVGFAVQGFFDALFMQGIAYSELIKISLNVGLPKYLLMRQKIKGISLAEVLNTAGDQSPLQSLNPGAFSQLAIMSMLLNFEDKRPDSFILESLPDGTLRLVCVDPSTAFFRETELHLYSEQKGNRASLRNILFCLDQMQWKVDSATRQSFLRIQPLNCVKKWLDQLNILNKVCYGVFQDSNQVKPGKIWFPSGFITHLMNKIFRLQAILKEPLEFTHLELLFLLDPELTKYYQRAFKRTDPLKRFASLWDIEGVFTLLKDDVPVSDIFNKMPIRSYSDRGNLTDLSAATKEYEVVAAEIKNLKDSADSISEGLRKGRGVSFQNFMGLQLDDSKQKIISKFDFAFEEKDIHFQNPVVKTSLKGYYQSISFRDYSLSEPEIQLLLDHSPFLQALELDGVQGASAVLQKLSGAKYLRSLTIRNVQNITELNLSELMIEELSMTGCYQLESLRVPSSLKQLHLQNCPLLFEVKASATHFLTEFSCQNCPQLQPWQQLFIPWYDRNKACNIHLTQVPVRPVTKTLWPVLQAIAREPDSLAILETLKASEGNALGKYIDVLRPFFHGPTDRLELSATGATDDDLEVFGGWFPQLRKLKLTGKPPNGFSDAGLKAFLLNSSQLTRLEIAFCPAVTDGGVEHLLKKLPGLLFLGIKRCGSITDRSLTLIASSRHNLRGLALSGCKEITDKGVSQLAQKCHQLESLDFSGLRQMTDRSLKPLLEKNPFLTSLDVAGCKILRKSISEAIQSGLKLRHLNLSHSHTADTTSAILEALATGCPHLQYLGLRGCSFEMSSLEACLRGCGALVYLDLSGNGYLADADSSQIAGFSPQLETLNLSFCKVSDIGFKNILKACPALKKLDISSCRGITKNSLEAIPELVPRLQILTFQKAIGSTILPRDLEALQEMIKGLTIQG